MPDLERIFRTQAEQYERLVSREDYQGNLLRAIREIRPLARDQAVVDLGSGTGRVSFLLSPHVGRVWGIEPVEGMRREAERRQAALGASNVEFLEGEHRSVPLPDGCADIVIEGWAFLVVAVRAWPRWEEPIREAFREVRRIVKPGGTVILIETLGTMREQPDVPEQFAAFYEHLERRLGYRRREIRTDYRFRSLPEAVELITFFFGDELGRQAAERARVVVPECTGVWFKRSMRAASLPRLAGERAAMRKVIESIAGEYRRYKALGEGAMHQLTERQLAERAPGEGNSVATLVWHVAGNLRSRFTDFLTSDGEKRWRDRDSEFESRQAGAAEVFAKWEDGWRALASALETLTDEDLDRQVLIRGQPLSVMEALHRSLTHTSYHVGQIVFLAKSLRGAQWRYLSIPPGRSREYNERPTLERGPRKETT